MKTFSKEGYIKSLLYEYEYNNMPLRTLKVELEKIGIYTSTVFSFYISDERGKHIGWEVILANYVSIETNKSTKDKVYKIYEDNIERGIN